MNTIHITATVNVAESIRRNAVGPASITLSLADITAAMQDDAERATLAAHLTTTCNGEVYVKNPSSDHYASHVRDLPTPDLAGWLEAWRRDLALAAGKKEEERRRGAERVAEQQARHARLTACPILGVDVTNTAVRADSTAEGLAAACPCPSWGTAKVALDAHYDTSPDALAARDANLMSQIKALVDEINAALARRADQEKAAREARLLPHTDAEERAMHERGLLDLDTVERRLDRQACDALRLMIEPPACDAEIMSQRHAATTNPASRLVWRKLRAIERRLGRQCDLMVCGRVQTDTQTADGRTLIVHLTLAD